MRYMPLLYDSTTSPSTSIFCSFSEIAHLLPEMSARGRETHPRAKFGLTDDADVAGLGAFGALFDLVLDLRAFGEALEALAGDRAEVNEDVVAAVCLRDEAVALRVVEPLHGSACHFHLPAPSTNVQRRRGRTNGTTAKRGSSRAPVLRPPSRPGRTSGRCGALPRARRP